MISFIIPNKMTDRPVFAMLPLGAAIRPVFGSVNGTGMSAVVPSLVNERPTKASAVVEPAAAAALAPASALAPKTEGAGSLKRQYQLHSQWAFRGLEPWRDPA
ncbi:hypothetical protein ACIHFE_05755 [Streptomyces sp. NPDC052396]|uniref:hypothetical protein n=1 Tax=Streptomyces sp. NPDC052396 TaxID=3365689 RepID=UPI0037D89185